MTLINCMSGIFSKIIQFIIGFLLIPIIVGIIGGILIVFIIVTTGIATTETEVIAYSQIGLFIFRGIILVILFFVKKIVAIGYLLSIILDFVFGFSDKFVDLAGV